jgi:hypothetical protein
MNDRIFLFWLEFGDQEKDPGEDCHHFIAVGANKHDVHIGHLSARVFTGHVQRLTMNGHAEQHCNCTLRAA